MTRSLYRPDKSGHITPEIDYWSKLSTIRRPQSGKRHLSRTENVCIFFIFLTIFVLLQFVIVVTREAFGGGRFGFCACYTERGLYYYFNHFFFQPDLRRFSVLHSLNGKKNR